MEGTIKFRFAGSLFSVLDSLLCCYSIHFISGGFHHKGLISSFDCETSGKSCSILQVRFDHRPLSALEYSFKNYRFYLWLNFILGRCCIPKVRKQEQQK